MRTVRNTTAAPAAIGPYSQMIEVPSGQKLIFCSGQIPLNEKGEIVGTTVEEQTQQVMKNMRALLQELGASAEDVAKTTIFLQNMQDFPKVNAIYGEFFAKNPPARSTVAVAGLPRGALVEIEMIVVK